MPKFKRHGKRIPTPLNALVRELDIDTEVLAYEIGVGKDKVDSFFRGSKNPTFTCDELMGICNKLDIQLPQLVELSKKSQDAYQRYLRGETCTVLEQPSEDVSLKAEVEELKRQLNELKSA
jgi:DNA-binding Xre family transcriptional regulator